MYVYIYICIELHMKRMSHSIDDAPNQFHCFFPGLLYNYAVTHQAMIQIDLQTYLGAEHLGSDMEKMNAPHR